MTKNKRKHRLFIDVTFSHSVSHREAANGVRTMLEEFTAQPVWYTDNSPYIDKVVIVERRLGKNEK